MRHIFDMVFFNNIFNYESLIINRLSNLLLSYAATPLPIPLVPLKTKKAPDLRQKIGRSWTNPLPGAKMPVILLRQQGQPAFMTRGFAPPDCRLCPVEDLSFQLTPHRPPDHCFSDPINRKSAHSSAEDERSCKTPFPETKMRVSSLRQPGYPDFRTRGFASPDYSDFALSEIFYSK
jgi:hypothetical protein